VRFLLLEKPTEHYHELLLNKGFSPAAIEALRPQVETIVDRMLNPLQRGSEVELMGEFANPMPVLIIENARSAAGTARHICQLVAGHRGFSRQSRSHGGARTGSARWSNCVDRFFSTDRGRNASAIIGTDLISLLIDIEEEGEGLTEEKLYDAQCIALLFAGHETTRNLIGNGMYTLLKNPQQTAELREMPELIRSAVEELLRFESPVQFTARVLNEDIEVCGQPIRKGWTVQCMLGAANRDPNSLRNRIS